jgi:hypothetical protein
MSRLRERAVWYYEVAELGSSQLELHTQHPRTKLAHLVLSGPIPLMVSVHLAD